MTALHTPDKGLLKHNNNGEIIKSPSDTTVYVPGLKRIGEGQSPNLQTSPNIHHLVNGGKDSNEHDYIDDISNL